MKPPGNTVAIVRFPDVAAAFEASEATLVATRASEVVPLLAEVERAARAGLWAVGYVSYEAAPAFDRALAVRADARLPLARFTLHARAVAPPAAAPSPTPLTLAWCTREPEHAAAIASIRASIAAGDVYQVNHTVRLRAPYDGGPFPLADALARAQGRGAFAAAIDAGDHAVACASPELFFGRRGERITARPMKGTSRRGRFPAEDDRFARALATSAKERAENVMIVDLLRNDLARVAMPGSVRVAALCEVERWRTVLQMTSTIEADLRAGVDLPAIFRATFPCGSVTGAPKVTAMRAIAALERSPREVYCGAVGLVRPGGDATFAVAIRTAIVDRARGELTYGVGSGVTWDSIAADEWAELRAKAAIALAPPPAWELLETMLVEGGRVRRLDAHLARLLASAAHLGVEVDAERLRAVIARAALPDAASRARLVAGEGDGPRVELSPLEAPNVPLVVRLADRPIDEENAAWFHKTTDRARYDAALARARAGARPGERVDDVLLWNRGGELTELSRGNLVLALDGERVTPPLTAGLLPGVLRAKLLAKGALRERSLSREDLARASAAWRISALHGEVPVALPVAP